MVPNTQQILLSIRGLRRGRPDRSNSELLEILTEKMGIVLRSPGAQGTKSTPVSREAGPGLLSSFGQTPGNKDFVLLSGNVAASPSLPELVSRHTDHLPPSTILVPFSPQAAPDVSQLPQERVQPAHNGYGKNSHFWRCLDTMLGQKAGGGRRLLPHGWAFLEQPWTVSGKQRGGCGRTWCLWYTDRGDRTPSTVDREMTGSMDLRVAVCMGLEGVWA